ncbi:Pterin 4 alpha carbinolamine dehydratase [Novymonas esmeraldas]|uniref:4a-hydroxytetrahydrobiopterin dehydratase n=1 Tax=Novymonas esmeraldas TaxID=1808958 RepID=A0AAW0EU96_9TRYP
MHHSASCAFTVRAGSLCSGALLRPPRRSAALLRGAALTTQRACKGDYGFNVFHNSNPQHGGSYARHERRMRDDEVEDFLKSVKHWRYVHEDVSAEDSLHSASAAVPTSDEAAASSSSSSTAVPAPPSRLGEEAITRTFNFDTFREAYLFMGRLWAFCYGSDKYPHVTWEGTAITVYLYSPTFRGLSKREARVAAFLNDQYNMGRKSKWQQRRIVDGIVREATVEELLGAEVAAHLAQRQAQRTAPLDEVVDGPRSWRCAIAAAAPPHPGD